MDVKIPHISEHRRYVDNFLSSSVVNLSFEHQDLASVSDGFEARMGDYLERFFGLNYDNDLFDREFLSYSNEKSGRQVALSSDWAILQTDCSKYVDFEQSVLPFMSAIKYFAFNVLEVEQLKNMFIQKTNIFPFGADNDTEVKDNAEIVFSNLLSPELLAVPTTPIDKDITIPNAVITFFDRVLETDKYSGVARVGIIKSNTDSNRYFLILDLGIQYLQPQSIKASEVDDRLLNMNDTLFDLFHWCISDDVAKMLK